MKFMEYPDRDLLMLNLADRLTGELKGHLLTHDRATFCVPGGSTPGPVFDVLSAVDLDWARISVVLNDERWVPQEDPRSNTRLLHRRLLVARASAARLLALHAATPAPEAALERLVEGVAPHLPISVLLLGMGEDMHAASLIPGAEGLAAALADDAPPLVPIRVTGRDEARVTLSLPVLREAMHIHVLITGARKRAALERARGLPPEEAPIGALLANATVHWAE